MTLNANGSELSAALPLEDENISSLKKQFAVSDLDECEITEILCSDALSDRLESCTGVSFSALNRIAEWAASNNDMYASQIFDAALEAYNVTDINTALKVIDHIYDFEFVEGQDYDAYGYDALYISERDDIDIFYDVRDFIDFKAYGEYRAGMDGAIKTEAGFIYSSADLKNELV